MPLHTIEWSPQHSLCLCEPNYQGQKRQRIAVWTLLYRLQLPSTYENRVFSVQCV